MEYCVNTTGKRVRIDVLANADKSLVGLHIENSRIISMRYSEFFALVIRVLGEREINNLEYTLLRYHALPVQKNDGTVDDSIIVMETIECCIEAETILDALKLYQASDIFSCYLFSYRFIDGRLHLGGLGKVLIREHAINWPFKLYCMTEADQIEFVTWFKEHRKMHGPDQNDKFRKMNRLYLDSYLIGDAEQSFVMLTVVLEMLFGSTAELNYRISRGVGIFLSHTRDEMKFFFKSVKRLYNTRSKYVHEGKRVSDNELFELREIVRKVIVLMYERGMHKEEFDFKAFSDEITYDGYAKE